jgi:hypothetical protein
MPRDCSVVCCLILLDSVAATLALNIQTLDCFAVAIVHQGLESVHLHAPNLLTCFWFFALAHPILHL